MPRWKPILTGEVALRAERCVASIAQELSRESAGTAEADARGAWLATGAAGQAVFFHQLELASIGEPAIVAAEDLLEKAVAAMASVAMGTSLYQGFTGIAWAAEHLRGGGEEDRNHEIDALLLRRVATAPWPATLDLVDGLAGIAVYAAERLPVPAAVEILEAVAVRFREAAEAVPEGLTWRFRAKTGWDSAPIYDLGLAHGVSGILATLALLHGAVGERTQPIVADLLDRGVSWLLAQEIAAAEPDRQSRFPGLLYAHRPPETSRLAWCYGDLAVAVALFAAAQARERADWRQLSLDVAAQAALRTFPSTKVRDAGLCHGAFGVAHLLNRLFQETGDPRLGEGALRWFDEGFALHRPGDAVAGFPSWWPNGVPGGTWAHDGSLLTGAAGAGLALLAAISTAEPTWDRVFLASFAVP